MEDLDELVENFNEILDKCISELSFSGFSSTSIGFFEDYPEHPKDSVTWWETKGANSESGEYQSALKPEFFQLIESLIHIIKHKDKGIQNEPKHCICKPNSQSIHRRYNPYYWGAIHTLKKKRSESNKHVEIQFFINLTKLGMRVGIYVGHQPGHDNGQWTSHQDRFVERLSSVFEEMNFLKENKGYSFVKTSDQDHATGKIGRHIEIKNEPDLLKHILEQKDFTLLKTISKEKMYSVELVRDIMNIFCETRKMYELLESRTKLNQRRLRTVKE